MKFLKSLYVNHLFFLLLLFVGGCFFVSFFVLWFFPVSVALLLLLLLVACIDIFILYSSKNGIEGERSLPERFSNGDDNPIFIHLHSNYRIPVVLKMIDEIPFQYQKRDFMIDSRLDALGDKEFQYTLRPTGRGEYAFGKLNVYANTLLRLVSRRFVFSENAVIPAYPSFIQLKKYDMLAFSNHLYTYGLKRMRHIGHTMEFEQIKEYVQGEDMRTVNWKATSKRAQLMVNQYQEEKSQPVYLVIDKGRSMQMPFMELSLLDYAINATLALSNIIIKKQDKAGVFTFSKKIENRIIADRKAGHMQKIMEALYRIDTNFYESDFNRLYVDIKQNVTHRSLIIIFTNFGTLDALYRQLPSLKSIAENHLLVVVFFDNTELNQLIDRNAKKVREIYDKVIAEKFAFEKRLIVRELTQHGIHCVLTQPENLTIDSINKYLEIKARGMI